MEWFKWFGNVMFSLRKDINPKLTLCDAVGSEHDRIEKHMVVGNCKI